MRIEVTEGGRGQRVAPFGIQANVVAPNYLYSEMYYPKARFVDSAEGGELIALTVPFGRLGQPDRARGSEPPICIGLPAKIC